MEKKTCIACGNTFESYFGENICPNCYRDKENVSDKLEINNIVSRHGVEWVNNYLQEQYGKY